MIWIPARQMICELCQSEEAQNFHHLIPKTLHSNKWFKRRYSREQMRQGVDVCRSCHRTVHDMIPDEKELGRHFNTREKLLSHPMIQRFVAWKQERNRS